MNRLSNKEIEKHYFEKFRGHYQLPSGNIIYGDKPDVIIDGERKIGIEITNFYIEGGSLPESEQRQSKLREKAVSRAHSSYKKKGKKITITFGFDKANPIPIGHLKTLVKKLVDFARRIENFETGELRKDLFKTIPELSFVYLNAKEYDDARWRVVQLYTAPMMSEDRLLEIVREKEKLVPEYEKCDAYWLLVIVDSFDRSQEQKIPNDILDEIETDVFEKVIVYEPWAGRVLESK